MKNRALYLSPILAAALAAGCQPSNEKLAQRYEGVVETYCLECHDSAGREAGLSLENVDLDNVAAHPELFETVARKLRGRQMPPSGGPRPDAKTYDGFAAYLERRLDEAALESPEPGHASIHRLNRTEYGNAVRDLLALEVDASEFLPADDEGYGFDNIADVLRVSPSLLEQYLAASAKIAALAVGDPEAPAVTAVYRPAQDLAQAVHIEGMPLGTRGGVKIRHYFPLDAEYELDVFLVRNIVGYMTGLEWAHELEIAVDGERVFLAQVGGEADNAMSDKNMSAAANEIDARLRTRAFVTAGPHDVTVAFLERSAAETHEPLELHTRNLDLQDMNGLPIVDYVNVRGPFDPVGPGDTPSRERIFTCRPADESTARVCAAEILSTLARHAFRRQPAEQDVATLLSFYDTGAARAGFDAGIESALRVILTSPKFLFRDEPDPAGVAPGSLYALDDAALASRLAFFLWSSPPDDELLELAGQGKLSDGRIFEQQVERMLADERASALVENFAGQWLFLRNLQSTHPDTEEFPDFDDNLRRAMRRETELLFEHVMREDLSVNELLTADYTFVNERLAKHYGMPEIYGSNFRKVPVTDEARRGLLGHASILTVTSYPNRTSPVLRGKWVLENVLGTPPPPPLPNVPALPDNETGKVARTLRERLAEHRSNPVCATCHDVMDPIGLGLENFDAVGKWRTREPGGEIDAHGQLANGTPISGAAELREALTADPEQFARVFTSKLLTYALGRGLEAYDMPTVRQIVREAEDDDYRFGAIVKGIVNSVPFRMRRAQSPDAPKQPTVAQTD
jgi:uncharacterized protein DUF1592/uncharacterized protein DUF1588/uncharacterized protein DUF1585/uncharacterized protein DUF1587/uncharacterized protein DUF1595/cbb3-type cytochrome c oxidase subunit III